MARAIKQHGHVYDYSKSVYVRTHDKVVITCHEHGDFSQAPSAHMRGAGCPLCAGRGFSTKGWIARFKAAYGDLYSYSNYKYTGPQDRSFVTCREHGDFSVRSIAHENGTGCPECSEKHMDTCKFVASAISIHGDRYAYDKAIYRKSSSKVVITCREHGDFKQRANGHLAGKGCQKCKPGGGWNHQGEAYLYLLSNNKGQCKIGVSVDCEKRLTVLSRRAPFEIEFCAHWAAQGFRSAYAIEQRLHQRLKHLNSGYDSFDGASEWFDISPQKAVKEINKLLAEQQQLEMF